MQHALRLGSMALLLMFTTGCSGPGQVNAADTPHCVPGAAVACVCPDARPGSQHCEADGTYSTCSCSDLSAVSAPDAGAGSALDATAPSLARATPTPDATTPSTSDAA